MFDTIVTAAITAGAIIAVGTVGYFGVRFMRDEGSHWARKSELDAISHAQAINALTFVSQQGTAGAGAVVQQDIADNVPANRGAA
jgi:hypothetical protein